mgnify:CR=1 FL=1
MKNMKNKKKLIFISIVAILIIAGAVFAYLGLQTGKNSPKTILKNPVAGLTDEEAVRLFDEKFVSYLLYAIDADSLHTPPLSSETPKIKFEIENEIFEAEIIEGRIIVKKAGSSDEDIIIKTSKIEAVKMLRDVNYVQESFKSGKSSVEITAGNAELFAKGYLTIYENIVEKV